MSETIPVILDTDIGSDIDDAVALAYLLRQPRCDLVGITTVSGDAAKRAACAEIVCREAGRTDVEIHVGATEVLLHGPGQPNVPQYEAVKHYDHRLDRQANYAVHFLRSIIRRNPGKITLLSTGPLTNIAILFALDPDIPWMLKGFVSMAGHFFGGPEKREWNVLVDPTAAAVVYNKAPMKGHVSVGLDVTLQCQLPAEEVRRRFVPKPLGVVLEMAEVWFKQQTKITFHDPLAAVLIFEPGICTYATGRVRVPMEADEKTAGRSVFVEEVGGPQRVARTVDAGRFFEHYFDVVK